MDSARKRGKSQFAQALESLSLQNDGESTSFHKRPSKAAAASTSTVAHRKTGVSSDNRDHSYSSTKSHVGEEKKASNASSQMQLARQRLANLPIPMMKSEQDQQQENSSTVAKANQTQRTAPKMLPHGDVKNTKGPALPRRTRSRSEFVKPTTSASGRIPPPLRPRDRTLKRGAPLSVAKTTATSSRKQPPIVPTRKPSTSAVNSPQLPAEDGKPSSSPRTNAPSTSSSPPVTPGRMRKPSLSSKPNMSPSKASPSTSEPPATPGRERKPTLISKTSTPPPPPPSPPTTPGRERKPTLISKTSTPSPPTTPGRERKPTLTSKTTALPQAPGRDRKPSLSSIHSQNVPEPPRQSRKPSQLMNEKNAQNERQKSTTDAPPSLRRMDSYTFEDLHLIKTDLENESFGNSVRDDFESSLAERFERQYDRNGHSLDDISQWSRDGTLTAADIAEFLQVRSEKVYTYLGSTIISVNPFKQIKGLYSNRVKNLYHTNRPYDLAPHLYSLGESCWKFLRDTGKPQAIVVSGDSGSGKTVACKHLMEYLAAVSISGRTTEKIKEAILGMNHILETFGNAQTLFNSNSSRFGRLTDLQFNHLGQLVGGHITTLTLEKSRVVSHRSGEQNFHIMYQLFSDPVVQRELSLGDPSEYTYLNQHPSDGDCFHGDHKSAFNQLQSSMNAAGIRRTEMMASFRIVAGILQLGNIRFVEKYESNGVDGCDVANPNVLTAVSNTLQLEPKLLRDALIYRSVRIGVSVEKIPQTVRQAESNRDTMAKKMYERLFDWIVSRINGTLKCVETKTTISTVTLVDIYGLEVYGEDDEEKNSFDQLCVNFVNEKLQNHFAATIRREEMELIEEGVPLRSLPQFDCDKCIDLIEGRPAGIYALLDEESLIPQGSDERYLDKMSSYFIGPDAKDAAANRSTFRIPRLERMKFDLHHFSSWVQYDVDGWLEKNRDTFMQNMATCLQSSTLPLLCQIFPRGEIISELGKMQSTLAQKFQKEVARMVGKISNKKQHFIKCILPNRFQKPDLFDSDLVEKQVRYLGLVEGALIGSAGYVTNMDFAQFVEKYKILCKTTWPTWSGRPEIGSELILCVHNVPQSEYAIGKSKIFFTSSRPLTTLNKLLGDKKHEMASTIQRAYRDYRQRRQDLEQKNASALFGGDATVLDTVFANRIDGDGKRNKTQVIVTDKGVALVDPATESMSQIRFDELSSVKSSPYVDGIVLLERKGSNGQDELVEFENKLAIVDTIHDQAPNVDCPVVTDFAFRSPDKKQVAFIANKLFHKTVIVLDDNDPDVILVNTRNRDDLYDGKKMRRKNSFVRKFFGDYIRLGGSDLMKQLQKDYGDKDVVFSSGMTKYNKKAKKQERLMMVTDRALYNLDLSGYMVNRRIPLTKIQSCFVSSLPDDFILIKCEGQDLLLETSKKTELLSVLQDVYQQENNANLRVHVRDEWKFVLDKNGEHRRTLGIVEDMKASKTRLVALNNSTWQIRVKTDCELPLDMQLEASDIYGGLKLRRKESLLAWHMGDYLFLGNNKNMTKMLKKRGCDRILFSGLVTKINKRYVPQKRRLVVTDQTILSLDTDKFHVNREIFINNLTGVSVSAMKDGFFVLHVNGEYDYVMETPKKTEIITALCKQYKKLTHRELKVLVDNKIVYRLANKNQRTIKFKHDPTVMMPTIMPYRTQGFMVKVNNGMEDYEDVGNLFTGEEQESSFYQNAGGQIVARVGAADRFDSVYGGRKNRARSSIRRQYFGDYCRLGDDKRMLSILREKGEKVLFSALVSKVNNKYKSQKRIMVITNHAVYNIDDDGFKVKRRIDLDDIDGVSVSQFNDGIFSLHCPNSYDYLYDSEKKTEIIDTLMRAKNGGLRINVADQFEFRPMGNAGVNTVSFVLDENTDTTFLQPTNQGLVVRVSNVEPPVVLESAFLHVKDQPKPIEVFSSPILLKLRKRWRYKLQIRFYVGVPMEGCYFEEKIDMVHKRFQQTSEVATLQPREEPYIIDLPEYSLLTKTRVKCKMLDKSGNVLFAVRFLYDVR